MIDVVCCALSELSNCHSPPTRRIRIASFAIGCAPSVGLGPEAVQCSVGRSKNRLSATAGMAGHRMNVDFGQLRLVHVNMYFP